MLPAVRLPGGRSSPWTAPAESTLRGLTTNLAVDVPRSRLDRVLPWVPRILSSKPHVIVLMGLGIYLVVLPVLGVRVSVDAELIGGNYTIVTSDIGACIAAGGTLHLINQSRKRRKIEEERLMLARQTPGVVTSLTSRAMALVVAYRDGPLI